MGLVGVEGLFRKYVFYSHECDGSITSSCNQQRVLNCVIGSPGNFRRFKKSWFCVLVSGCLCCVSCWRSLCGFNSHSLCSCDVVGRGSSESYPVVWFAIFLSYFQYLTADVLSSKFSCLKCRKSKIFRCCEDTMTLLRSSFDVIIPVMEVLLYDPLHDWTMAPVKVVHAQVLGIV